MITPDETLRVVVIGVHLGGEGYPNVQHMLEGLRACPDVALEEHAYPLLSEGHLSARKDFRAIVRAGFAHLKAWHALWRVRTGSVVYIPYPALFLLLLWSLLPPAMRARRRIVADAFISVYDALVNDRKRLSPNTLSARMLRAIERRALRAADAVVVDTPENASFMALSLGLERARLHAIGLCIDEVAYALRESASPRIGPCRVVFTGTLIPLHGIAIILSAIELLADREDLEFVLIGDGQEAPLLETFMATARPRVRWSRRWHRARELAEEVACADVCLGVFSTGAKTQRVGPLKVHAYACMGKAIITADTAWAQRISEGCAEPPFVTVPAGDAKALATAITRLAEDPALRVRLGTAARAIYTERLGNPRTLAGLRAVLFPSESRG